MIWLFQDKIQNTKVKKIYIFPSAVSRESCIDCLRLLPKHRDERITFEIL